MSAISSLDRTLERNDDDTRYPIVLTWPLVLSLHLSFDLFCLSFSFPPKKPISMTNLFRYDPNV
jgi:hypothetical protein